MVKSVAKLVATPIANAEDGGLPDHNNGIFRQVRTPALDLAETTLSILCAMTKMFSSNVLIGIKRGSCEA